MTAQAIRMLKAGAAVATSLAMPVRAGGAPAG
jgi:hypothetical protein